MGGVLVHSRRTASSLVCVVTSHGHWELRGGGMLSNTSFAVSCSVAVLGDLSDLIHFLSPLLLEGEGSHSRGEQRARGLHFWEVTPLPHCSISLAFLSFLLCLSIGSVSSCSQSRDSVFTPALSGEQQPLSCDRPPWLKTDTLGDNSGPDRTVLPSRGLLEAVSQGLNQGLKTAKIPTCFLSMKRCNLAESIVELYKCKQMYLHKLCVIKSWL